MSLECSPTGRITYRQLAKLILDMDESQMDCLVTLEDGNESIVYDTELRICGIEHFQLADATPVLFFRS
jgi:hypothetical protein